MRVCVVQMGSVLFDTAATMARMEARCREAAAGGAKLAVFPEALLGGYPKGLTFGAVLGERTAAGREDFLRYSKAAITCPGVETEQVAAWARELDLHVVVGVVERVGSTLYCTALLFTPDRGLVQKHRKLMPTGTERLVWGMGDGSDMQVTETALGRVAMAICWENYMPIYRQHLYAQGVDLWCAPTVDAREIWQASMRHVAYEGRCFVLSACQVLTAADWPAGMVNGGLIDGRSLIVAPSGELVAGPVVGEGLGFAEIDLEDVTRGRFDLDVVGHYGRADLFRLEVGDR